MATNNEAEYEALILGLKLALDLKIRHLQVCSDSKLIFNHVNDCYEARDPRMMAYLDVAKELKIRFVTFNIKQIPGTRMHKFDIPSEIICDNGSQFIRNKIEAFCVRWNISLQKYTPRNPQSNGQAESTNKIIVENLKKKLEEIGGKWAEELPRFSKWENHTQGCNGTNSLTGVRSGKRSFHPVRVPTHRYGCITEDRNQVEMASSLDTIDELRISAQIRMASYRQTVARSYNKNVKIRTLQVGDLDLRKVFQNTKN
ncbi:uncharacterized protein LOC141628070 [Silene latifolia]|uniref:uncharacterized protein LOC141628070 n=1 Tax=Silene latifolia TaxID=37657 RepID=UPI003D7771AA